MKKITNLPKVAALIAVFYAMAIIPEPCSADLMEKGDTTPVTTEKRGKANTLDLNGLEKNIDTTKLLLQPNRPLIENTAQAEPASDNAHRFSDPVEKKLYDLADLEVMYSIGSERRN